MCVESACRKVLKLVSKYHNVFKGNLHYFNKYRQKMFKMYLLEDLK